MSGQKQGDSIGERETGMLASSSGIGTEQGG